MNTRTLWLCAIVAVLLHSVPAHAQLRPHPPISGHAAATSDTLFGSARVHAPGTAARGERADARGTTLGNVALMAAGLATMYLAYDQGEEGGGGFGTAIGVIGAVAFWVGVVRQVTR
ncbi:MAG TPA: hypothetical protein VE913_17830 [Longimicrobium sp.]|nr:hypothetical protein [Longimicrobium sp.]